MGNKKFKCDIAGAKALCSEKILYSEDGMAFEAKIHLIENGFDFYVNIDSQLILHSKTNLTLSLFNLLKQIDEDNYNVKLLKVGNCIYYKPSEIIGADTNDDIKTEWLNSECEITITDLMNPLESSYLLIPSVYDLIMSKEDYLKHFLNISEVFFLKEKFRVRVKFNDDFNKILQVRTPVLGINNVYVEKITKLKVEAKEMIDILIGGVVEKLRVNEYD